MILRKCLEFRANILRKCLLKGSTASNMLHRCDTFRGVTSHKIFFNTILPKQELTAHSYNASFLEHRKWYCNRLIDGDVSELRKQRELKKITELFPEARVTLHILSQRTPDKIYDVHYKQHLPGKKAIKNQEWTCTYRLIWPEKMKFECTAISKRVAAEKAATQALHWLYTIGRIDTKGQPIYDQKVIEEIKSNLEEPIHAEISLKSVERVEKIWTDY